MTNVDVPAGLGPLIMINIRWKINGKLFWGQIGQKYLQIKGPWAQGPLAQGQGPVTHGPRDQGPMGPGLIHTYLFHKVPRPERPGRGLETLWELWGISTNSVPAPYLFARPLKY